MTPDPRDDMPSFDTPSLAGETASEIVLLTLACLLAIGAVIAIEALAAALLPTYGE